MKNAVAELIERMEQEAGCRVDDNSGDNMAMAGLFGALARAMNKSCHSEKDDIAAGILLRHQMTSAYAEEQASMRMVARMLMSGMNYETIIAMRGKK